MRRLLISIIALAAVSVFAQEEKAAPEGVPARLEAINNKVVKALLQKREGDKVTFRVFKSERDIPVDKSKIKSLTFFPKYDEKAVTEGFNGGDFSGTLAELEPVMDPYLDYMCISNNMQPVLFMMLDSYRESEDYANVKKMAQILIETERPRYVTTGKVNLALASIATDGEEGLIAAEKIRPELEGAAGLYLQACIEHANGQRLAHATVCELIAVHGNDMEWMPAAELLSAELYLAEGATNRASNTARQVGAIYKGTYIAKSAERMRAELEPTTDETE